MTEQLIALEFLHPNKYQPRQHEDPVVVQELAENIERNATDEFDGLLQAPTVRHIGEGHYELAFGHTRKAAFALLFNQGKSRYGRMRAYVRDLSDVQMFEAAVAENIKRRDLNPIEQAESMRRYMDEFGKTSAEAGEFFNCSEENVRAKVRLLNLPATVQDKMREGEINETAARSLLTLTRVLPNNEEALLETVKEIDNGERPEQAVEQVLRSSPDTKIITVNGDEDRGQFSTKAKTFKYLPELTVTEASHHCGVDPKVLRDYHDKGVWQLRIEKLSKGIQAIELPGSDNAEELERMRKIQHLVKPPACTACSLFATIDGVSFCGWVACFDRKKAASEEAELQKVSETVGIAVYSEKDGKALEMRRWNDKHENAFIKKHADLRLCRSHSYNTWEGIPSYFAVVAVGNLLQAWNKQEEKAKQGTEKREGVAPQRQRMINNIVETQTELFAWDVATPIFASALDGVAQVEFLECLLENSDFYPSNVLPDHHKDQLQAMKKAARLQLARRKIMFNLLFREGTPFSLNTAKRPATALAKEFQKVATTWGVKLPKDFLTKAAEYDEAVKLEIAELDKPDKDGAE